MSTSSDNDIIQKITLLAGLRLEVLDQFLKQRYEEGLDITQFKEYLEDSVHGIFVISQRLGLEIDIEQIIPDISQFNYTTSFFLNMCLRDQSLTNVIQDTFGKKIQLYFSLTEWLTLALIVSRFIKFPLTKGLTEERKLFIQKERKLASEFIVEVGLFLEDLSKWIKEHLSSECAARCKQFIDLVKTNRRASYKAARIPELILPVLSALVPTYGAVMERLRRAKILQQDLIQCKPGWDSWRQYESICTDDFLPLLRMDICVSC